MELVPTRSGNFSLRVVCPDGQARLLHSLYDPVKEAETLVDAFDFSGAGMVVVLGLGLGYHVERLGRLYPDAEIVVVEASPEIFELCQKHGTGRSEKVHFLSGLEPKEALAEISRLHFKAGLPALAVFSFAPGIAFAPQYYEPVRASLEKSVSLKLWERLRYPGFSTRQLTVALFDFEYFLTEEIARALCALGHSVVRIRGNEKESCAVILGRAMETIASRRPDFFMTINHLGFDEDGVLADFLRSIGMPAVIWYVDTPNIVVRAFPRNASPYCMVFTWDESCMESLRGMGFENVEYLPLAADETIFKPMRLSPTDRRRFETDIGFVANSMVSRTQDKLLLAPPQLHPAVERIAHRLGESRGLSFRNAVQTMMRDDELAMLDSATEREKSGFEAAVFWKGTLLYRLSHLRALEEFRPAVYGDEGWKELLNENFRISSELRYYKELPVFYNACRINFNATNLQMETAVNQRVFDAPACGAFLLTDRQPSLDALFEEGKEVITYGGPEELVDLARFYLRNESARKAVALKGRERVLREHTYKLRVNTIIRRMRELYG